VDVLTPLVTPVRRRGLDELRNQAAVVRRILDVLRNRVVLQELRCRPGRPWACASDALDAVHRRIGLVGHQDRPVRSKCAADIHQGRLKAGDRRWACHAGFQRREPDFLCRVEPAAKWEPCTPAVDRSAASPCAVEGVRALPEPWAGLPAQDSTQLQSWR
jgi:hypothetical protein